jgi:hypothetical protein
VRDITAEPARQKIAAPGRGQKRREAEQACPPGSSKIVSAAAPRPKRSTRIEPDASRQAV